MAQAQPARADLSLNRRTLATPPREIVRWLKEELQENHGHLELYERAWKQYSYEEDFDRAAYGIASDRPVHLVAVEAILDVEPLVEQGYWILQVKVEDEIGPLSLKEEWSYSSGSLSLDQFAAEFLEGNHDSTEVFLMAETAEAESQFYAWLKNMTERHGLRH